MPTSRPAPGPHVTTAPLCPMSLRVGSLAAMLNAELADDPVYDGIELQWFDDDTHGTGMLAFLSRRGDRTVDYYAQRGLRVDPGGYTIGGGTGAWTETDFDVARLEVAADGVTAAVRFTDVDGRTIELDIDDRDGRPRDRACLLAPVGAGIDRPGALLLVWMHGFDLVRVGARAPSIRVAGREARTGRLPLARLHRRHLVKYAAPVVSVELNRDGDGPPDSPGPADLSVTADGSVAAVIADGGGHSARVTFEPPIPDLRVVGAAAGAHGRWRIAVDDATLTGGTWSVLRTGDRVDVTLDVRDRWRPGPLPPFVRLVTTVVPVFRRWPTTYAWRASVALTPSPVVTGGWHRTGGEDGMGYRRATRS